MVMVDGVSKIMIGVVFLPSVLHKKLAKLNKINKKLTKLNQLTLTLKLNQLKEVQRTVPKQSQVGHQVTIQFYQVISLLRVDTLLIQRVTRSNQLVFHGSVVKLQIFLHTVYGLNHQLTLLKLLRILVTIIFVTHGLMKC